ncbi:MAG: hypothetical protein GWQ08_27740 [Verrucomicrobiaceae bacterium]|nr:hypothetical protein [Verrucomicrobiaceae bacterium]
MLVYFSVGLVRVYNNAISDDDVVSAYDEHASAYGRSPIIGPPFVALDSRGFPGTGSITAWTNIGSLGGSFEAIGDPQIEDVDGVLAVTLDGVGDWLVGPTAPDSVTGSRSKHG